MNLFPNGILPYASGGLLIGLAVAVVYLGTAIKLGASTFLESTLTYVPRLAALSRFEQYVDERDWRVVFTLGIVSGALVYALLFQSGPWITDVQWWRLGFGGVLVGIGTRLGQGCTSGHGICGIGSLSGTSIANVATFVLVAIGVAHLVEALGVVP